MLLRLSVCLDYVFITLRLSRFVYDLFKYSDMNVQPKSVLKTRKSEFDGILEDDDSPRGEHSEGSSPPNNAESFENIVSINVP